MASGYLVLEDGSVFKGSVPEGSPDVYGEVVFETGMGGHLEAVTDPAAAGTIVVASFPLVGNAGAKDGFMVSDRVHASGLVAREVCRSPSDMYGGEPLGDYMVAAGVPCISGIDTRDVVATLRDKGTMMGAIVSDPSKAAPLLRKGRPKGLVAKISHKKVADLGGKGPKVAVIDCGSCKGLYEELLARFNVIRFPYDAKAREIIDSGAAGAVFTDGPGDPHELKGKTVETASDLIDAMPCMGISLGAQVMALARGGEVFRMKTGHRGCNQPVRHGGRIHMTFQSHGYGITEGSVEGATYDHINVNDGSVEGFSLGGIGSFAVLYRPQSRPGPTDTEFLFDVFAKSVGGRP
ncbi:MAG: carbamoyl phosphate synthase small subunit [Thermoplasmatales archaeon]|nr:carbamoyl phosphate synthase small subunit [Thermoplasmatales archaeon]